MESSSRRLRVALAQINPAVGDLGANSELIAHWIAHARDEGAAVVVLPELALTGYPPEDLLLKRHFLDATQRYLEELAWGVEGIVALVGAPAAGEHLSNALWVLADGHLEGCYRKMRLPNYGVFDERRYFEPGAGPALVEVDGARIALTVCEDIWVPGPPATTAVEAGADLIVNASASPYHRGKGGERERMVCERARGAGVPIALCNMVGGQDELVFDGHSLFADAGGETLARAAQFEPELLLCDLELEQSPAPRPAGEPLPILFSGEQTEAARKAGQVPVTPRIAEPLRDVDEVYAALRLGLADYIRKNRFEGVVLGLSGGIDSALVAMLAADVIDPPDVHCVVMPSPHSSEATQHDARRIATNLDASLTEIPIAGVMSAFEAALAHSFEGTEPGIAEENLQARIRGTVVMALSNKFGWLPLATGNKSEMSVGYSTLYGDMAGGFAVIKDVPKTLVPELVRRRNELAGRELVPSSVIERPPSAELRADQRDSDSLPPYEILDRALAEYVEHDGGIEAMIAAGIGRETALEVIGLVDRAEFKRRQAAPGVRISPKSFGRDRRMPITNRFGA